MVKKEYVLVLRKIYEKAEKLLANRLFALIILIVVLLLCVDRACVCPSDRRRSVT